MEEKSRDRKRECNKIWRERHPEYARKWRDDNPEYFKNYLKEYEEKNKPKRKLIVNKYLSNPVNRKKHNARVTLRYAVKTGKIIKPDHCNRCGDINYIQADHHDYDKPLDVTWLCRKCHQLVTDSRR